MVLEISVREILSKDTEELWDILPKTFLLKFDNNEIIETNNKSTIFTSYYWDIIRQWPNIIVKPIHHLDHYIKKSPFGSGTHRSLIESFYKDIAVAYGLDTPLKRDSLNKLIFQVNNNAYNRLSVHLYPYMTSIDILDFIEVADDEEITEMIKECPLDQLSVSQLSENIVNFLYTTKRLSHNRLVKATRAKIVKDNQVSQCVGVRGYPTDVDSMLFKYPIMSGYVNGLNTLYDSMTESRSAAKSLLFSTSPLQFSEYLSRRIQLMAMTVERIHYEDCGSDKYMNCLVTADEYDEFNNLVKNSNLPLLVGKYYLDEETNTLKVIRRSDKHLLNKWVKIRSVVAGCRHPDPHGVCAVCFGEMAQNVQPGANLGHLCGSVLGQIISQLILSVKHHEKSADISYIKLSPRMTKFFYIDNARDKYYLQKEVIDKGYYIEVPKDSLLNLNDILNVKDLSYDDISRTAHIDDINLFNSEGSEIFNLRVENRFGILSKEFIQYIKEKKWIMNNKSNYVFDISDWDYRKPFIILPKKHYNNIDLSKDIEALIQGSEKNKKKYRSYKSIFWELFDLINSRLNVNFAIIEIILYSSMIISEKNYDMRLPKADDNKELGILKDILARRSLSGQLAYQNVTKELTNPETFFPLYRENYIMDVYIDPKSVIKKYYGI